ncbi:GIY-YIG nuclease family protein [Aureimonas mangrovi]|uniref:GIY-YIG nuclease family protein n=1 Tax=Aureimonas mangrovi TaxID=2758041 RepID=UPI00163DC600|nr:GIY-YIG nuclease family protein [Aureimonas mangrovi]
MGFDVSTILGIADASQFKLHAARWNGDENPLDVYARDPEEWQRWNTWRGTKDDFNRRYILSLIHFYPEGAVWLFGGAFEVLTRRPEHGHTYDIRELDEAKPLVGRLKVSLNLSRGRSFLLENQIDKIEIVEVLKERYTGQTFSGYDNVSLEFAMLETLVLRQRLDWKTALANMKGVYLIVDRKTGKKYVGSAYGETGIWSRWGSYVATGHGFNKQLIPLDKDQSVAYARENFRLTLLEAWPFRTEDVVIIKRESFWKEALLTRGDWGYNSN